MNVSNTFIRSFAILLLTLLIYSDSFSQVSEEWLHRYTGPESSTDTPTKFTKDAEGNFYVTGRTIVGGSYFHIVTVKYNSSGVRQWIAKYIGAANQNDEGTSILTDNSGNVYVSGVSRLISGQFDIILLKYNSSGVQQWVRQYNGPGNFDDISSGIALDNSGYIYAGGYSYGSGTGYDYLIIKYNLSGDQIWTKRWNAPSNADDYLKKISLSPDGKIVVTGFSYNPASSNDFVTQKYDTSGTLIWTQTYNGPNSLDDQAVNLKIDNSDNIYVTGKSRGTGTGSDYATVKYSSAGVQQWVQRYNGPFSNEDIPSSVDTDNSGNVYVTGYTYGTSYFQDYLTVKYNSSGVQQWAKNYNGVENYFDRAADVKADNSGNVYVTGKSIKSTDGTSDAVTVKYNSAGTVLWVKTYNGSGNLDDDPVQMEIDNNSVFVLSTSSSYFFGPFCGTSDYLLLKFNSSGGIEFETRYDGSGAGNDAGVSLALDNTGNTFVTGYSFDNVSGYDYATIKYNSSGAPLWVSRYDGFSGNDKPSSVCTDNSGNIYVTGYSTGSGTGIDIATIKYNSSGAQQWAARYNGPADGDDYGVKVAADNSGNVYVSGYGAGTGTGNDYVTLKYNSSGVQQWVTRFNGSGNADDIANSMVTDASGNIFVTGKSSGAGTMEDILTVKYNSAGAQQWTAVFNGSANNYDEGVSVTSDISGNIIVCGKSKSASALNPQIANSDMITVKYNSSGTQQWSSLYNGTDNGDDEGVSVVTDNSGNIFTSGNSKNTGSDLDYTTVKYNSAGTAQWVSKYNGSLNGIDKINSSFIDNAGNIYVSGFCSDIISNFNYCTIKYNQNGSQKWIEKYNYQDNDSDKSAIVNIDAQGNVYVTGSSKGIDGAVDFLTIKYKQEKVLELRSLIEGFYNNVSDKMIPDSVKVYLRNSASPYSIADSSVAVTDSLGQGNFIFKNALNGISYYIVISHRNSIETWSSAVQTFVSSSMSYDITDNISKAYGNNLQLKGSKYCLYSGDVNKDGIIDASDLSEVDNGTILFLKGRNPADLNGDEVVDVSDLSIVDNNSNLNVAVIRP